MNKFFIYVGIMSYQNPSLSKMVYDSTGYYLPEGHIMWHRVPWYYYCDRGTHLIHRSSLHTWWHQDPGEGGEVVPEKDREALHIHKKSPTLNRDQGHEILPILLRLLSRDTQFMWPSHSTMENSMWHGYNVWYVSTLFLRDIFIFIHYRCSRNVICSVACYCWIVSLVCHVMYHTTAG